MTWTISLWHLHRREFLGTAAASFSMLGPLSASARHRNRTASRARPAAQGGSLGVPGPYPGRVIEVRNRALQRDRGGTARRCERP